MEYTKKYFEYEKGRRANRGSTWTPPETPEPLIRTSAPQKPFPVEALGPDLSDLVRCISEAYVVPVNQVVHTLLACISYSVQHLYDLQLPNMRVPLSLYFFLIARSGARITSAATPILNPVSESQAEKMKEHRKAKNIYLKEFELYKSKLRRLKKQAEKAKLDPLIEAELAKLVAPIEPLEPLMILTNPTIQGLEKCLIEKYPSILLHSTEGGALIGGYSMLEENLINTIAKFSQLWDGKDYANVTATNGSTVLRGKRLAVNLSAQKTIAEMFTGNSMISEQGCLARFLLSRIHTPKMPRPYSNVEVEKEQSYLNYCAKVTLLLSRKYSMDWDSPNSIITTHLRLSDKAFVVFRDFYDKIEQLRCGDLDSQQLDPFLSKSPEHMLRVGGCLSVFDHPDLLEVQDDTITRAAIILNWFIGELVAINDTGGTNPWLVQCDLLVRAINKHKLKYVWPSWICSYGPTPLRNRDCAKRAIETLIDYGHLAAVAESITDKGKTIRSAHKVRLEAASSANSASADRDPSDGGWS